MVSQLPPVKPLQAVLCAACTSQTMPLLASQPLLALSAPALPGVPYAVALPTVPVCVKADLNMTSKAFTASMGAAEPIASAQPASPARGAPICVAPAADGFAPATPVNNRDLPAYTLMRQPLEGACATSAQPELRSHAPAVASTLPAPTLPAFSTPPASQLRTAHAAPAPALEPASPAGARRLAPGGRIDWTESEWRDELPAMAAGVRAAGAGLLAYLCSHNQWVADRIFGPLWIRLGALACPPGFYDGVVRVVHLVMQMGHLPLSQAEAAAVQAAHGRALATLIASAGQGQFWLLGDLFWQELHAAGDRRLLLLADVTQHSASQKYDEAQGDTAKEAGAPAGGASAEAPAHSPRGGAPSESLQAAEMASSAA